MCPSRAWFESQDRLGLFSVQNCIQSILAGHWAFSCNRRVFPSSFLFPFIIYHCKIYQLQSNNVPKKEKNPKRLIKANIKNLLMHITSLCYSEQPIRCVSLGSKAMFPGSIGLTGTQNAQNESANLVS